MKDPVDIIVIFFHRGVESRYFIVIAILRVFDISYLAVLEIFIYVYC
jgi:hypothetical protein